MPDILEKHVRRTINVEKKNFDRFKQTKTQMEAHGWPGPGSYKTLDKGPGPTYSMGTRFVDKRDPPGSKPGKKRFDSQFKSKPHLHPKKSLDPGPGAYEHKSSIKPNLRPSASTQLSTFGGRSKGWIDLPQGNPAPNQYSELFPKPIDQRAFTNEGFAFPK